MTVTRTSARARLLDTATTLFYRDGINVTGIDRVIAGAGVAKASLYNNFSSKDELIAAYLEASLTRFLDLIDGLDEVADARERLARFFTELARSASDAGFSGCPFANAAVEVAPDSAAHQVIVRFYDHLARFFARVVATTPDDPAVRQLIVCYDGAMSAAKILRDPSLVTAAAALAQRIVEVR